MTLEFLLAFFFLLTIASLSFFIAPRVKAPYTVFLVAIGLLLVPLANTELFGFLKSFKLTPELLFYIFLPILLFESAYNIRVRHIQENILSITSLAVVSLLISTVFIAAVLYSTLGLVGASVPIIVLLIFGALISATDPVAVLALFKEYGAPQRLSLIFEGESLFNDGTAVALFFVLLEVAYKGYNGVTTIAEGLFLFTSMVVGGILFGLLMGGLFSKLIQITRSNQNVSIILMLVMAHLTFILAEMISHHAVIMGVEIKVSAIIATTIASIVLGNYGRYKIAPEAEEFVEKFWGQFAFIANSIVFILMGLLFANLPINVFEFTLPILLTVVVVAIGRALSVYPVIRVLNWLKLEDNIPTTWQNLLAWGSLRGALAITMVLLIPNDWRPEGWNYNYSPQEFIMALTIGCIYATLFIKALTIGPMIRKSQLNLLTDVEAMEHRDALNYLHTHMLQRLNTLRTKSYIDVQSYEAIIARLNKEHDKKSAASHTSSDSNLAQLALNIQALGIERSYLHDLFVHGEVTDWVIRRIQANISHQIEKLEKGETLENHPASIAPDWLDQLIDRVRKLIPGRDKDYIQMFLYYRAKTIITRKVVKEITRLSADDVKLFTPEVVESVINRYRAYNKVAEERMISLLEAHKSELDETNVTLASVSINNHREQLLNDLLCRELITPKVYVALRQKV